MISTEDLWWKYLSEHHAAINASLDTHQEFDAKNALTAAVEARDADEALEVLTALSVRMYGDDSEGAEAVRDVVAMLLSADWVLNSADDESDDVDDDYDDFDDIGDDDDYDFDD